MSDDEAESSSASGGASWDTFFSEHDSNFGKSPESPVKQSSDCVSKMPYQKATCFGAAPLDNDRYLRLIKCNQCDKIIKHIGYANHVRRRHLCNPYEQNGTNSADEAPDFLLSPPYVSTRKSSSISTANSPFYTSEKRDDLLLVLKRARVPLMTKTIQVENSSRKESPDKAASTSFLSRHPQRPRRSIAARLSFTNDPDCVALRTRNRHPETPYFELPTSTRHHKPVTIPQITVSSVSKNEQQTNKKQQQENSRANTPDSIIILYDDSNQQSNGEEFRHENEPVEFSFVYPDNDAESNDNQTNSTSQTNAMSNPVSSRPSSKNSCSSSRQSVQLIGSPQMFLEVLNAEEEEEEEISTPQSSTDYQNDNSLPSSSSPEMPQLERQDLYPSSMEESNGDSNNDMAVYPNNFPLGTLVFTPTVHHLHQMQQHTMFNNTTLRPINAFALNPQQSQIPPSTSYSHVQSHQQTNSNQQQVNGHPPVTTFFCHPTVVLNHEPPNHVRREQIRLIKNLQQNKVATINRGAQQPIKKRQMTIVGQKIKATSVQSKRFQHPQRKRVFNSPVGGMTAQQLPSIQASVPFESNRHHQKLPPPIILSNPNNKRSNSVLLQQRNRNSPIIMNYMGGRSNSPSSVNSSTTSSTSYTSAKSAAENAWYSQSNEFVYYNEPSARSP